MTKAFCTGIVGQVATFQITGEMPIPAGTYILEEYSEGTQAQNKAFHALVQEYWRSGMHSYNANSFLEFRDMIKRSLGSGFESFAYADVIAVELPDGTVEYKPELNVVTDYSMIPEHIRKNPDMKHMIRGRLKSWSDYTKRERKETLDRLISEMHQSGVNSKKFDEIIQGMGGN